MVSYFQEQLALSFTHLQVKQILDHRSQLAVVWPFTAEAAV